MRNRHLEALLEQKGFNNDEVWSSIATNEGSAQHLDFLTDDEKDVFKTAHEVDQLALLTLAADRQQYVCQGQSLKFIFAC